MDDKDQVMEIGPLVNDSPNTSIKDETNPIPDLANMSLKDEIVTSKVVTNAQINTKGIDHIRMTPNQVCFNY